MRNNTVANFFVLKKVLKILEYNNRSLWCFLFELFTQILMTWPLLINNCIEKYQKFAIISEIILDGRYFLIFELKYNFFFDHGQKKTFFHTKSAKILNFSTVTPYL
jgi:CDP-diglyceride synthetase